MRHAPATRIKTIHRTLTGKDFITLWMHPTFSLFSQDLSLSQSLDRGIHDVQLIAVASSNPVRVANSVGDRRVRTQFELSVASQIMRSMTRRAKVVGDRSPNDLAGKSWECRQDLPAGVSIGKGSRHAARKVTLVPRITGCPPQIDLSKAM